ncbi:Calmodulin-like protein 4 [Collichthys lucidus]|uniref:Calmodulin-like protein 4 n=1 Tax=Collichthys lucidus TaxID=240159 RepID=A0A4U5TWE3_COLLU|nr:Calmodulin-like protein 4 [Collichthys lucidus]
MSESCPLRPVESRPGSSSYSVLVQFLAAAAASMAKYLTQDQINDFKECFSLYDRQRKGKIEAKELITVMRCLGSNPTPSEVQRHLLSHSIVLRGRHGDYVEVLDSLRGRHGDYVQVLDSLRGRHGDYVQVLDSLRGRHRDYVQVLDSLRGRHGDYVQVLDSLRDVTETTSRDYVQVLDSLRGRHRDYVQVLDSLRGRHGDYVQGLDSLRGRHRDYVQVLDSLRGRHRDYVQVLDSLRGRHRDYVQVLDSLRGHCGGELDFSTLLSIMHRQLQQEAPEEEILEALRMADKEQTGFIMASELRAKLTLLGEKLTDREGLSVCP